LADGLLDLPLPGAGQTRARFAALAGLARADPVLARLGEGHADAVAILAELGGPAPGAVPWGVWAADPRSVVADRTPAGWRVTGERAWCSGAGCCVRVLVTAGSEDGVRLFAVDLADPGVTRVSGSWPAIGMAGSDSRTVRFVAVPATPVGGPGQYGARPGFWAGAAGVAACWYGGAAGVADELLAAAARKDPDPHLLAHLGAVDAALGAAKALLNEVADLIDAGEPDLRRPARRVRAVAEDAASTVLDRVGRALGAGPLCHDAGHARRVADLSVYLRQSHAERDLAELGQDVVAAAGW
jgi:alkylation response protein AidB-like acyl-CoA dehydrogenase